MITEYRNITAIKSEWESIIDNANGRVYLTYEFNRLLCREFQWRRWIHPGRRLLFVCNNKNGRTNVIFPLVIDRFSHRIFLLGSTAEAGYNDIVCALKITKEEIKEVLDYIQTKYSNYQLILKNVSADSKLNAFGEVSPCCDCYRLTVTEGFDTWCSSLSKKMRQTIRSAYNRLQNDSVEYEYHTLESVSFSVLFRIYRIYLQRLRDNREKSGVNIKSIKYRVFQAVKSIPRFIGSPFWGGFNQSERSSLFYLTIDGKIVAFFTAFKEKDGFIFPRCGFDDKYKRYSPGLILFCEMIKNNGKRMTYDLSRGYHEYKIRYGADLYYINKIEIPTT